MNLLPAGCAVIVPVLVASGCSRPADPPRTIVADAAWTRALMPMEGDAAGLRGGDGAASHPIPGGRTLWLFGDSWIGRVEDGRYVPGTLMVNNVAAVHATPAPGGHVPPEAVEALWGPPPRPGVLSAFVKPESAERGRQRWCWPCDGALVYGPESAPKLAIFYADLGRRVEDPSPEDVWNFRLVGSRVAVVENPLEAPGRWRISQHALEPRDPDRTAGGSPAISWGVAAMHDPETGPGEARAVLVFGVDGSNPWDKLVMLARVTESRLTEFGAWRFWDGRDWSERESAAAPVARNGVDEFTIHRQRIKGQDGWVMIQGEPVLGHRIFVRTAERLTGPWSDGRPIYTIPEPSGDRNLITYGAKGHPHLSAPGELLISYCINSVDFGQMARDVEIYRPRFVRVPVEVITGE